MWTQYIHSLGYSENGTVSKCIQIIIINFTIYLGSYQEDDAIHKCVRTIMAWIDYISDSGLNIHRLFSTVQSAYISPLQP